MPMGMSFDSRKIHCINPVMDITKFYGIKLLFMPNQLHFTLTLQEHDIITKIGG